MPRKEIESHLPQLMAYAVVLTRDADQAQDLVHDCVIKALETDCLPQTEAAYRPWLFAILHNTFIDGTRRPCANEEPVAEPELSPTEELIWTHDTNLINALTVRSGMEKLGHDHRNIIALVDVVGFSYKEAAGVLDIEPGTVMSRLSRARRALLRHITGDNLYVLPASSIRNLRQ